MALKYGLLVCETEGNVGDDIQALAAGQHLPRVDIAIDRERIHQYRSTEPVIMIMNGWFSSDLNAWPPAPSIRPVFASFHVTERFKPTIAKHVDYLKQFEPIGTRDVPTADFLQSLGVRAETTYCLTLTFPQRPSPPKNGKVFLVDAPKIAVPKSLRRGAFKVPHAIAPIGHEVTLPYARRLLDVYRDTASLVITTRLHAALPCIAMGIPVIYFGNAADPRTSIISEIGGTIYDSRLHSKSLARGAVGKLMERVDWTPEPLDIAPFKQRLAAAVSHRLASLEQREAAL